MAVEMPSSENQEEYVKKGIWDKIKDTAGKIPFVPDAVAMYFCALDPKTPLHAKAIALSALAYFIFPLDAFPDALPVVGYSDDAGAVAAAIAAIGPYITDVHRKQAADWLAGKKTNKLVK